MVKDTKKAKPEPATAEKPAPGTQTPPPQGQTPPGPPPADQQRQAAVKAGVYCQVYLIPI